LGRIQTQDCFSNLEGVAMSVKDVTVADIALLELLDGSTPAPEDVLQRLAAAGHVSLTFGRPTLTESGRARAEKLKPAENDLRRAFASTSGRAPLTTDGASSLHVGGGSAATIRG
jgi:hypothetical protein